MTVLLLVVAYILGVVVSVVFIAWVNADMECGEDIPPMAALLSWLFIASMMVMALVAYPLKELYDWCLRKFEKGGQV